MTRCLKDVSSPLSRKGRTFLGEVEEDSTEEEEVIEGCIDLNTDGDLIEHDSISRKVIFQRLKKQNKNKNKENYLKI